MRASRADDRDTTTTQASREQAPAPVGGRVTPRAALQATLGNRVMQQMARQAGSDQATSRLHALAAGLRNERGEIVAVIRAPGPADPAPKEKNPIFPIAATNVAGSSGLTAVERTAKRTEYPGSVVVVDAPPGQPERGLTIIGPRSPTGSVRGVESTQSALVNAKGDIVVSKQIDSDKTAYGVSLASKGGTTLPDGAEVTDRDAELFVGRSEKTARAQTRNAAATSEASTYKTFVGSKHTTNGFDAAGDFREQEDIAGRESRRVLTAVESRDSQGRRVASERALRELTTDGRSQVDLRNTGTKYQALDLDRVERLRGHDGRASARRSEHSDREVDHADGSRQREASTTRQRGEVTTRERAERLAGGRERRVSGQSSRGTTTTLRVGELSRDEGAGRAFTGKVSADAAYGARSTTSFTINKPGATPIAARAQQGSRVTGGRLGVVTPTGPDARLVVAGDKAAFEDPKNAAVAGSYSESIAFSDSARTTKSDDYEVNDRGVAANVSVEGEAGTLRSFLRKDRLNFGWLIVENALSSYYLAGVSGRLAGGVKAGVDANNVNVGASGSVGVTRRVGDEVTIRVGGFYVKVKAEADAFVGAEAALSAEAGHSRGAGAGAGAGASAFAGARAGLGGKLEGGYDNVAFAAGAYKLRGSAGVGFKANFEARYLHGYYLLAGGLGLSAELGLGADVELRVNPTAVGAALAKRVSGLANTNNLNLAGAAGTVARGAASGANSAYRWLRGLGSK